MEKRSNTTLPLAELLDPSGSALRAKHRYEAPENALLLHGEPSRWGTEGFASRRTHGCYTCGTHLAVVEVRRAYRRAGPGGAARAAGGAAPVGTSRAQRPGRRTLPAHGPRRMQHDLRCGGGARLRPAGPSREAEGADGTHRLKGATRANRHDPRLRLIRRYGL